jgi:hypothetical protein
LAQCVAPIVVKLDVTRLRCEIEVRVLKIVRRERLGLADQHRVDLSLELDARKRLTECRSSQRSRNQVGDVDRPQNASTQ